MVDQIKTGSLLISHMGGLAGCCGLWHQKFTSRQEPALHDADDLGIFATNGLRLRGRRWASGTTGALLLFGQNFERTWHLDRRQFNALS